MKNGYFIGNINPTFSDKPILMVESCHDSLFFRVRILEWLARMARMARMPRRIGASAHVSRLDSCEVGGTYPIFTALINLFMACKIMFPVKIGIRKLVFWPFSVKKPTHFCQTLQASGSRLYSSKDAFYTSVDLVQIRNVKDEETQRLDTWYVVVTLW